MLHKLEDGKEGCGIKINLGKTNVMRINDEKDVTVEISRRRRQLMNISRFAFGTEVGLRHHNVDLKVME